MTDWKRKLAAYLHDPPSKALDIRTHGERSDAAFRQAGFTDENEIGEYLKHADHAGAAADRLPFPLSHVANLQCAFDGVRNAFIHPLSGARLPYHAEFKSAEQGIEGESSVQPRLDDRCLTSLPDEAARWRARFFAHWRLWPKHACERDYRLAFLPADTRIPDHSIWTHMQVVSALDGCVGTNSVWRPAFLKFQLGPVQDFIAAARSIRDLWSGSYLLSWLMAAGLKALSAAVGPDAVVFPNLRGQPLFDLHWRGDLWGKVNIGTQTVWESLAWENRALLTPNLPNVFLAVVPADRAANLGQLVEEAVEAEWKRIAQAVWNKCEQDGLTADEAAFSEQERRVRFNAQVDRFPSISWHSTPWPETLEEAVSFATGFAANMPVHQSAKRVEAVVRMATSQMPFDHRDRRYYTDDSKATLNNIGLGWSVILALNSWELDAVRQTRGFLAVNEGGWQVGAFNNKDALTGREEAVAGGTDWLRRANTKGGYWPSLFKKGDWLGAPTLIKRVWHRAYLEEQWGLRTDRGGLPMPNTRGIAAHEPDVDCSDDEFAEEAPPSEKYFAVLALDGDEIGKWISGEKTPHFASQLADYKDGSGVQRLGAKPYFEQGDLKPFLAAQRPLSPSYHLQFSEALSNFALICARPIVEAYDGRLIYAGGDDVIALLPADTALACASALRRAFTGLEVSDRFGRLLFNSPAPGFLSFEGWRDEHMRGRAIPFLVPGPAADCSVGIAIAHFKTPLQDVVRSARTAENRAKRKPEHGGLDRKAVAVTLMKRSGEVIEWGAKWDGGLELHRALASALEPDFLSSKFPHRFAELLAAYRMQSTPLLAQVKPVQPLQNFPVDDVVSREFEHCLNRQRGTGYPRDKQQAEELLSRLRKALEAYLRSLDAAGLTQSEKRLQALIGLCRTVAFTHRTAVDSRSTPDPKGSA